MSGQSCFLCKKNLQKDELFKLDSETPSGDSSTYWINIKAIIKGLDREDAPREEGVCSECAGYIHEYEIIQLKLAVLENTISSIYHAVKEEVSTKDEETIDEGGQIEFEPADGYTDLPEDLFNKLLTPTVLCSDVLKENRLESNIFESKFTEDIDTVDDNFNVNSGDDNDYDNDNDYDDDNDDDTDWGRKSKRKYKPRRKRIKEKLETEKKRAYVKKKKKTVSTVENDKDGVQVKTEVKEEAPEDVKARLELKKKTKLTCSYCDYVAGTKEEKIIHESSEHAEFSSRSCDICQYKTKTFRQLIKHKAAVHSVILPFPCSICRIEFSSEKEYSVHRINVHLERLPCHVCGKVIGKGQLEDHVKTVHSHLNKEEHVMCEVCSKTFRSINLLNIHRQVHKNPVFECKSCSKKFRWDSSLRSHIQSAHNNAGQKLKCEVCNWEFADKNNLKNHMYTHSERKPFNCTKCDRGFIRKDMWSKHFSKCGT